MFEKIDDLELRKAFEKMGETGVLTVPKHIETLGKDFGLACEQYGVKELKFEKGSQLKSVSKLTGNNILTKVDFSNCNELTAIKDSAFMDMVNLKHVVFPKENNLKVIEMFAFDNCDLTELELNNSTIETIEENAFSCPNLRSVNLSGCPKLTLINDHAFSFCRNLQLLDLSGSDNITIGYQDDRANPTVRINSNIKNEDIFMRIKSLCGKDGAIEFCNKGTTTAKINFWGSSMGRPPSVEFYKKGNVNKTITIDDKSRINDLSCLNIKGAKNFLTTARLKFDPKNPNYDIPSRILNIIESEKEAEYTYKNWERIRKLINVPYSIYYIDSACTYAVLKNLGYLGPDVTPFAGTKKDLEDYRFVLARNMLSHQLLNQPKEQLQFENEEKQKAFFEDISKKAQKIAQNSGKYSLNFLVEQFVLNNITKYEEDTQKFIRKFSQLKSENGIKINFNTFLVQNFDDIVQTAGSTNDYGDYYNENESISLEYLYNNFETLLGNSNKEIISRKTNNYFSLADCIGGIEYEGAEGFEKLATYCQNAHLEQKGFDWAKNLFTKGVEIEKSGQQVLKCKEDNNPDRAITYEFIKKDNPLGLVLGNMTNCCQCYDEAGASCVECGETNPNSGFIAFKKGNKVIGQAWVWYDESQKAIALDNIEIPKKFKKEINGEYSKDFCACVNDLCVNLHNTMEDEGHKIDNVVIGNGFNDVETLEKHFLFENNDKNIIICNMKNGQQNVYSDVSRMGQYAIYKDGIYHPPTNLQNATQTPTAEQKKQNMQQER